MESDASRLVVDEIDSRSFSDCGRNDLFDHTASNVTVLDHPMRFSRLLGPNDSRPVVETGTNFARQLNRTAGFGGSKSGG